MFSKKLSLKESQLELNKFMATFKGEDYYGETLGYKAIDGCCGVSVLWGWENTPTAQYKKYKKPILAYLKNDFDWRIEKDYTPGSVVTTVADYQVDGVVPILKTLGFKLVSKGTNGNTGNSVFVWAKTLQPTKKTGQPTVRRSAIKKSVALARTGRIK